MHQLRRTRLLVAVPTALLLSVAAVGCGNLIEDAAEDRIENELEKEGVSADLDDLEDGVFDIEATDAGVSSGKLPKDFPTDEVPVVDGKILLGQYTNSPKSWTATIEVGPAGGDKTAAYDEAEAVLLDGGLENVTPKVDNGTSISGDYTSESYAVKLAVTDSTGIVVAYIVTPK